MKSLVEHGEPIDAKDKDGCTPLHKAALRGHKESAALLTASGANANAADNAGNTPLFVASRRGHREVVELLRKHGAKE